MSEEKVVESKILDNNELVFILSDPSGKMEVSQCGTAFKNNKGKDNFALLSIKNATIVLDDACFVVEIDQLISVLTKLQKEKSLLRDIKTDINKVQSQINSSEAATKGIRDGLKLIQKQIINENN